MKINSIVEAVFYYAEKTPNKLCLADDDTKVTYKEYKNLILNLVNYFVNCKLKKDEIVLVEANQSIIYLAIELAIQLVGAIFIPLENKCSKDKIKKIANETGATFLITDLNCTFENIIIFHYNDMKKINNNLDIDNSYDFPCGDSISEILFSTGTTGKEKGIILTHRNNIALAENVKFGVDMKTDNIEMVVAPLNHSHGLRRYYANMFNGSSVILLGNVVNIKGFFDNLDKFHVNSIDIVPPALSIILKLSKNKLAEYKNQLRYVQLGSATIHQVDKEKICDFLPNTNIYNFYGSTESGCTLIENINSKKRKENSIGKPTINTKICIVDEDKQIINSSKLQPGFIASYGKMNMIGYWKDRYETENVLIKGFVYSRDIAYFDEDGDIILLGREGDVINVGGEKVSVKEIEENVLRLSGVEECAVIPVKDEILGFVPKLFVQFQKGKSIEIDNIRKYLQERLDAFKVPVYIESIEQIPKTFNGKIRKNQLK